MAAGSLNLRVSKEDFEKRIGLIEMRMNILQDVIERYGRAKENIDQFMESDDSNVDAMLERIDQNVVAAKKSHAALNETKLALQQTVDQMSGMSKEVMETLSAGTEAAKSAIEAGIKISAIL
jgi:methyl-accepting chemotaxis protein